MPFPPREECLGAFLELREEIGRLPDKTRQDIHDRARAGNGWFTRENVDRALDGLRHYLRPEPFAAWFRRYPEAKRPRRVGVVMAGNIPLAGWHDFMAVLAAGHMLYAKPGSQDGVLLPFLADRLKAILPALGENIHFDRPLKECEALIATGGENGARHFRHYFAHVPHVIRHGRRSCAVLDGSETAADLHALAEDCLLYFGLGCRSVSKVFLPENQDVRPLLTALETLGQKAMENHKYAHNYTYRKALFLMNKSPCHTNGAVLFCESQKHDAPPAVIGYERYSSAETLRRRLCADREQLQCVVAAAGFGKGELATVSFGRAQWPDVEDYADGVDTRAFLAAL